MFSSDSPVKSVSDDLLNRKQFVKQFSKLLVNYKDNECLVVGFMGSWGSGKTSILNFITEEIKQENCTVVDFNPWYFSNQNSLLFHFFDELGSVVEFDTKDNVKKLLLKYVKYLCGVSLRVGGQLSLSLDFKEILKRDNQETFISMKNTLIKYFSNLNSKIIVKIDDIDRLNRDEMKQIFNLVKSLADFPKVIYILSFDYEYVKKVLSEDYIDFDEFIKKIINIPIHIPEITQSKLNNLVYEYIEPFYFKHIEIENEYQNDGFLDFLKILTPFFRNLRDLKRYVNIVNFYDEMDAEVNFTDFMIIIALQHFENDAYNFIKHNKETLTMFYGPHEEYEHILMNFKDVFSKKIKTYNGDCFILLRFLFPDFDKIVHGPDFNRIFKYDAKFGIKYSNNFDKYFTFSLEENEVSKFYIDELIKCDNVDIISQMFLSVKGDKSVFLIDKFIENIGNISQNNIKYFIESILDIGDELNRNNVVNSRKLVFRMLKTLYDGLESKEIYFKLLEDAIDKFHSIFTVVESVFSISHSFYNFNSFKRKSEDELPIKKSRLKKLESNLDESLWKLTSDVFLNINNLNMLLGYWCEFGDEQKIKSFVKSFSTDIHDLLKLLQSFKRRHYTNFRIDYNNLKKYYDLDELLIILKNNKAELSDEEYAFCNFLISEINKYNSKIMLR